MKNLRFQNRKDADKLIKKIVSLEVLNDFPED